MTVRVEKRMVRARSFFSPDRFARTINGHISPIFMPALRNIPATDGWADYVTELRTPSGDPVVGLGTSQEEHS